MAKTSPVIDLSGLNNCAIVGGIDSDVTEMDDDFGNNEAKTTVFDGGESFNNIVVVDNSGILGGLRNLAIKGGTLEEVCDGTWIKFNGESRAVNFGLKDVVALINNETGSGDVLAMENGPLKILGTD